MLHDGDCLNIAACSSQHRISPAHHPVRRLEPVALRRSLVCGSKSGLVKQGQAGKRNVNCLALSGQAVANCLALGGDENSTNTIVLLTGVDRLRDLIIFELIHFRNVEIMLVS